MCSARRSPVSRWEPSTRSPRPGLVVTYTTSGIFNFAQGAIGMFMAFIYWQLTQGWGLAEIPALLLVVLVIAPAVGRARSIGSR